MMTIRQHLLLKLAEECAEVSQRALKQMQFGRDEVQKDQDKTNGERLREEINDVVSVVTMLIESGGISSITSEELLDAVNIKQFRIEKYLKYSQELGMVENNGK
jgi:NTP pyrophosphatase (non-canonical NTP hydrolase)